MDIFTIAIIVEDGEFADAVRPKAEKAVGCRYRLSI